MKKAAHRIYRSPSVRFLMVGGINFLLVYAIYLGALEFMGYRAAYWCSLVVGLLFTSLLNIRHTFSRRLNILSIVGYGIYYYCYSLLHVTLISILIEDYQVIEELAPLMTLVALTPLHFVVSKLIIKGLTTSKNDP